MAGLFFPVRNQTLQWNTLKGCLNLYWADPVSGSAVRAPSGDVLPVSIADAQALKTGLTAPDLGDWAIAELDDRLVLIPPVRRVDERRFIHRGVVFVENDLNSDKPRFSPHPQFEFVNLASKHNHFVGVAGMVEFFVKHESLYPAPLVIGDALRSHMKHSDEAVVAQVNGDKVTIAKADGQVLQNTAANVLKYWSCARLAADADVLLRNGQLYKVQNPQSHAEVALDDWDKSLVNNASTLIKTTAKAPVPPSGPTGTPSP